MVMSVTGSTGTGKSTYTTKYSKHLGLETIIIKRENFKYLPNLFNKKKCCIIFEDIKGYFSFNPMEKISKDIVYLLGEERHSLNVIIFVGHSLKQIPDYICDYIQVYVLFHSKRLPKETPDFEEIYPVQLRVNSSTNKHHKEILVIEK